MDLFKKCRDYKVPQQVKALGYYPYFKAIQSAQDTEVTIEGQRAIMIGSNNYLGLTNDPRVKEAAVRAVERYGTGCTGSRFLNGTLEIHEELEYRLARFQRRQAALVFSTGFQTNLGAISALVRKGDWVIIDRDDHASIVDGCRLSFGKNVKFKHNDPDDLDRVLASAGRRAGKLVVVDGVFSMLGDVCELAAIARVSRQHGARLMVDDAHAIGVLGAHGRGTAEHSGVEDQVDIVMGTFSKSFASLGGFIASDTDVIEYVKHHGRSMIFSAAMPPAAVATVLAALDIIEQEPERREWLWANVRKMKEGLARLGFDTGTSQTPIIPIIIGDDLKTFRLWRALLENGVYTNAAISPAVPPGMSLLRTSYMATHTSEQLDRVLEVFEKVGRSMGVIP
ncbi:MAG: aminotransferase class I/II-fold pyridoxal phosphate-dependent enzyme [Deltaproteobacteria bacterium]|nr:aminotransferase class I/II-fold pyridoxal phosphate-dependent enzyme [Deltaproteobacteria bacterium]